MILRTQEVLEFVLPTSQWSEEVKVIGWDQTEANRQAE